MSDDKKQQDYPSEEENAQQQEKNSKEEGNEVEKDKEGEEEHHDATAEPKPKLSITAIIFFIFFVAAFAFSAGGIAIGMMDHRRNKSCLAIWGDKPDCNKTWFRRYNFDRDTREKTGDTWRTCEKPVQLINGAQAFSVMCVIGSFLTSLCALLEVLHYAELAVVACIMGGITCIATLVVMSTMLAFYYSDMCSAGAYHYREDYRIGNGLILFITAFCVEFTAVVILGIGVAVGEAK